VDSEYTHSLIAALDRWGDRLNAVLVKEVRQALRNRRFIGGFMLALVAALLVTLGTLSAGYDYHQNLRPQAGKVVFYGIYVCLAIVSSVLVPFEAYSRFAADRAQASDDLIQITSLSAWRILLGKLQAAGVTLLLYLSAMVPFSTFAYLLRGVTPTMIIIGLLMTAVAGFTAINLVLFLVTLLPKKQGEALAMLGCLGVTVYLASGGIFLMEGIERSSVLPRELWIGIGLTVLGFIPFNAIIFSCTAARVSFASANKETIPRLSLLAMNLFIVIAGLVLWSETGELEVPIVMSIVGLAWWAFAGFFLLAVPDEMSQRVRNTFPRFGLMGFLLWPGRGRAYAFYLLNTFLLCLPAIAALQTTSTSYVDDDVIVAFAFTVFYASFFPALPAALFSVTRRRWNWPQNLIKATFLFLIIYVAVQTLIEGFSAAYFPYSEYSSGLLSPVHALSPIMGIVFAVKNQAREEQMIWNVVVGGLMALFVLRTFLPAMGRSIVESFKLSRERKRSGKQGARSEHEEIAASVDAAEEKSDSACEATD
jgi:hypothetical protein